MAKPRLWEDTMKLWEITIDHAIFGYVICCEEKLARDTVGKSVRYFTLRLVEEIQPTTSNMVGLLYAIYLKVKDKELEKRDFGPADVKPVYFESVLNYISDTHLSSTWRRHVTLSRTKITLKEHIDENRDREIVSETIKNRLVIRRNLLEKEKERLYVLEKRFRNLLEKEKGHLDVLEKRLKNLEVLPINDR